MSYFIFVIESKYLSNLIAKIVHLKNTWKMWNQSN